MGFCNDTLPFTLLNTALTGKYDHNKHESVMSTLYISVGKAPRLRGKPKTKYTAFLGDSVKLRCPVSGTDGPRDNRTLVVWFKNDRVIQNTHSDWSRFLKKNEKHLKIVNVQGQDAGNYTCKAANFFGKTQLVVELKVKRMCSFVVFSFLRN